MKKTAQANASSGIVKHHIGDIAVFRVGACLTREAAIATIREHYPTLSSGCVIWEFAKGTTDSLTREDFAVIQAAATQYGDPNRRKTALVGSGGMIFAAACIYSATAALTDSGVQYAVFAEIEDAVRWLRI